MNKGMVYRAFRAFAVLLIAAVAANATAAGYSAQAGKIYDASGQEIQIRGINHFGFNATILRPMHLWEMGWKEQIAQIKSLGFNAIRVPFVPDTLHVATPVEQILVNGQLSNINTTFTSNQDLIGKTPLQVLDLWMVEADRQGMYVLLDFHSVSKMSQYFHPYVTDPNDYGPGGWVETYDQQAYTVSKWLGDLAFVADRYKHLAHFFGIDIFNEPHDRVRWEPVADPLIAAWKPLAEAAAAAILAVNPDLLIFVQGITANWDGEDVNIPLNWSENLRPQAYSPLNIASDKLVFAMHSYGPDVFVKPTFSAANYPANLAADWETLFGFLSPQFAVVPGEWGGRYGQGGVGPMDVAWQNAFVDYLISKGISSSFYWCYTPNSGDTGGILDDSLNVRQDKMALLQRLWGAVSQIPETSLTIFDDAVTPLWALSGWSSTPTIQSQFVKSGVSAVKVDATTWGGISFDSRDANWVWTDQPANRYTHLNFDVSAGPVVGAAMSSLEASLDLGWGRSAKISPNYVPAFAANVWYHVEIPLPVMNPEGVSFRKIVFQNNSTSNLTYYIDNVVLVNRTPGAPCTPSITNFSPGSGPAGTEVTLNGSCFTGSNGASVGTVSASLTVISDTQVKVTIPAGATTGAIGISNPTFSAFTATSFTVTVTATFPQQSIANFSPASGPAGTVVTLNGSGFTGSNGATVGAVSASLNVLSGTQAQVTIPAGATTGAIGIFNPTFSAFTATSFTVTPAGGGGTQLQSCAGIMPLGDSITAGTNGNYRNDLYTGLLQNNCGVSYVGTQFDANTLVADKDHEGHGGFYIGDENQPNPPTIANSVNGWMATTQPNIILLMAGTNDTAWWTNDTASQHGARHDRLIAQIQGQRPNAWIFVASIPRQRPAQIHLLPDGTMGDRALLVQQSNDVITANVAARVANGERVRLVDVYGALGIDDLEPLTINGNLAGVHPKDPAAYAKIATAFLVAIRAALGTP